MVGEVLVGVDTGSTSGVGGLEQYPRPSLAVDPAVLSVSDGQLWTVLWRRQHAPFIGEWALPGVFVAEQEELEAAALRGLRTKLGLNISLKPEQLFAWTKPGRDPRGWVATVAYYALVPFEHVMEACSRDVDVVAFALETTGPQGALVKDERITLKDSRGHVVGPVFDHSLILGRVVARVRSLIWHSDVALQLLPEYFTLRELQGTYESILGRNINKDSFRRRVTKTYSLVVPTGRLEEGRVGHRKAELYTRNDKLT